RRHRPGVVQRSLHRGAAPRDHQPGARPLHDAVLPESVVRHHLRAAAHHGERTAAGALSAHRVARVPLAAGCGRLRRSRRGGPDQPLPASGGGLDMAFIRTTTPEEADSIVTAMYLRQQSAWGYVPNYAKVFSHRPEVLARWGQLLAEIKRPMDKRRFELVT